MCSTIYVDFGYVDFGYVDFGRFKPERANGGAMG